MKKMEVITRPDKIEEVKQILNDMGIYGMTVSMVSGCGIQRGRREVYRGTAYDINLLPKIMVEMVVKDEHVEPLIEKLCAALRTNKVGDGKIFVYPVLEVVRIRTGERGESAI